MISKISLAEYLERRNFFSRSPRLRDQTPYFSSSEGGESDKEDLAEDWDDFSEVGEEEDVGEDGETNINHGDVANGDVANGKTRQMGRRGLIEISIHQATLAAIASKGPRPIKYHRVNNLQFNNPCVLRS